jgi:hypothetical protein
VLTYPLSLCLSQGMDTVKAYVAERDALEALPHEWALPAVEVAAAARLRRLLDTRTL